ncbi:alpha/beta fold hydrolase [Floridanema evergladense]|uniref:Alpha/beta fold hydrolase n=1 Tax=Floridaenema evergladense BLCC-F167 TaxID=3153639 RepID=A0ABV4WLH7_9CYAN
MLNSLPVVEILPSAAINGANGAFASVTNTIYLAKEFVEQNAGNPGAITSVLLEETGHYIDSKVNVADAAGDEGDIFARVVQGKAISASELLELKGEDDTAIVTICGKDISIEKSQIAMASLGGKLYQSHRGMDNKIYTRSYDGRQWSSWNTNYDGETPSAPALAGLNGRLYQSHRGFNNKIYTRSSTDGVNWSRWFESSGWQTSSAPALEALDGQLYQSIRGLNNKIYTRSSTDGIKWSAWNSNLDGETPTAPSLAGWNRTLYQSAQGLDNKIYTRSATSLDGANYWTGWQQTGGETPTELNDLTVTRISSAGKTFDVSLNMFDGNGKNESKGLDSRKDTIVVIHGWNGNDDPNNTIGNLAAKTAASNFYPNAQVITLNWSGGASDSTPQSASGRISAVARWGVDRLRELGIDRNKTILFGHSLGSYVAAKMGEFFGGVKEIVALDPAAGFTNLDVDGDQSGIQGVPNLRNVASSSIAFVASDKEGGAAGDNDFARTANTSLIVSFSNYPFLNLNPFQRDSDYHSAVAKVFANQITRNLRFPSFNRNGWYSNFGGKRDWFVPNFDFSHEGVIDADLSDRNNPKISRLRYVSDDWGTQSSTWT